MAGKVGLSLAGPLIGLGFVGSFIAGTIAGRHENEQTQKIPVKAINKYDENHDYELNKDEAFKFLDVDQNGTISVDEIELGRKLRNHFDYIGKAILASKGNIDSVLVDAILRINNLKEK